MKNLATFCLSTFLSFSSISAAASDECIQRYRKKFFKKSARFNKAAENWDKQSAKDWDYYVNNPVLSNMKNDYAKDPRPTKKKYKIFEDGIIKSYELELTSSVNQPEFFRSLYQESKQIDDNITPQFVQDQLKKLMDEGKFCTSKLFGIVKSLSKQDEVKSMVLNSIKSKLVADVDNANEDYNVNSDSLSKQERLDLRKNISRSTASSSSDGKGNQ
jgi:hypothetical protein